MNTTTATALPAVLAPGDGEVIEARGVRVQIRSAAERQLVCDYTAPAGFPGPGLHIHPGFDETFLVMAGTLSMRVGDEEHRLGPGASAFVPGATPHTFANAELEPVRFLLVCSPGGFEEYFRAVAAGDEAAGAEVLERFGYAERG